MAAPRGSRGAMVVPVVIIGSCDGRPSDATLALSWSLRLCVLILGDVLALAAHVADVLWKCTGE
jgi:hypothetical protein